MVLGLVVACTAVQPYALDRAPTERWLGTGLAMRAPSGGQWEEAPGRVGLRYPDRRWGVDRLVLETAGGRQTRRFRKRLANGSIVRFDETQESVDRVSRATLEGMWDLEGRRWQVTCVGHAEAELGGASARWCLRVLASARVVEPKP